MRRHLVTVIALALAVAPASHAAVLCQKRSGALFAREACKKRETPVDPAALGLVGPKGDPGTPGEARAFACSEASGNGNVVVPCSGRQIKNITSIVPNLLNEGVTCFVPDPSISLESAVVLASFADAGLTSAANVIINAVAIASFNGCPPNSIIVTTGRYRQGATDLDLQLIRLSVTVAVL